MDVLTVVEERVRDGVRSRGIDPQADPSAVREMVDAAVADVLAQWPLDADDRRADPEALAQHAFSAVAGFGPLQQFFDDPDIEEMWINERLTAG